MDDNDIYRIFAAYKNIKIQEKSFENLCIIFTVF